MRDNWLTGVPENIHDMIVTPKTKEIKIWLGGEDVGLEISFRRISFTDLDNLLARDRKHADRQMQAHIAQMPPEQRVLLREAVRDGDGSLPTSIRGIPEYLRDAMRSSDLVGTFIKGWVKQHCVMDDGLIPLLNIEQMSIYHHGERFVIKDGVAGFLHYCAAFGNRKSAINISCTCAACSQQMAT